MNSSTDFEYLVSLALDVAKKKGASQAVVEVSESSGLSVSVRKQSLETVEEMNDRSLAITVFNGKSRASASTSLLSEHAVLQTVSAAWDIAKYTDQDPFSGLPDPEMLATEFPDLDLYHAWDIDAEKARDIAMVAEAAALDYSDSITNSDGASLYTSSGSFLLANTHGFMAGYKYSSHSTSVSVMVGEDDDMHMDYWYSSHRNHRKLANPSDIGLYAAQRALSRLGAKRIPSGVYPVIFEAPVAISLLGAFAQAISGGSLYRKSSFLCDSLGKEILSTHLSICDDPFIPQATASAPFDNEGVTTQRRTLLENGVLQGYLLSTYSARKLGMSTTGNAGGSHNMSLHTSLTSYDFEGLIKQMGRGLIVTELMGSGVNYLTGDYSRAVFGYWVENGVIQHAVTEITIAGNLKDMYKNIVALGSDRITRGSKTTGSILIEKMSVAGI